MFCHELHTTLHTGFFTLSVVCDNDSIVLGH